MTFKNLKFKYIAAALITLGAFSLAAPAHAGWTDILNQGGVLGGGGGILDGIFGPPNPFGDWHGVDNRKAVNQTLTNPFGDWRGVGNTSYYDNYGYHNYNYTPNPFGDWTGVNNSAPAPQAPLQNYNPNQNPFSDWSGVNNTAPAQTQPQPQTYNTNSNPFGDWTGVNNLNTPAPAVQYQNRQAQGANNPFAGWTGVNNSASTNPNNPFADWSGVNNSTSTSNPFSDWSGVGNNNSPYDASGYQVNRDTQVSNQTNNATRVSYAGSAPAQTAATPTFTAPKTGVDKTAPLVFAGMLTAAFLIFRKRKWLFN